MEIAQHWRLRKQRYGLVGEVCNSCGTKLFPPRDVCPECHQPAYDLYTFSGRGEVFSYTTVQETPEGYEEYTPYTVAMVKLAEGPLVTAQLTDLGDQQPHIGMPVEMVTRKLRAEGPRGIIQYGYKFRPALQANPAA